MALGLIETIYIYINMIIHIQLADLSTESIIHMHAAVA